MSKFQDQLDKVDRVRVGVSRLLVQGQIDGFELLAMNHHLDDVERKIKGRRLAIMLSRVKDERR